MKSKKKKSGSLTYQYVIIFGILLAAANLLLGVILIQRSTATVRSLIRKNMLDISNTAAGVVDADKLASLTKESVGSSDYQSILNDLSVFQKNVDIEYIYAVREDKDGTFIFTVDADPNEPADFGEEVLVTDALVQASKGTAAVDDSPAQDEWGNFYSSYSPVIDSGGKIAGIIGVDFDSEWYENQIRANTLLILIISALFVLVGVLVFVFLSRRLQKRFNSLNEEITELAADVDSLTTEFISDQGYISSLSELDSSPRTVIEVPENDEIGELSGKIRLMHSEMKRYLEYAHRKAVTDALTNVSNTTAYSGLKERLEGEISKGSADFALALFDINDLKITNDRFGHMYGDLAIQKAADAIASVFGTRNTFRIGGDELLAAAYHTSMEDMKKLLAQVDERIAASSHIQDVNGFRLSISKGAAVYDPGRDTCFKDVFKRADQAMYHEKERFHAGR